MKHVFSFILLVLVLILVLAFFNGAEGQHIIHILKAMSATPTTSTTQRPNAASIMNPPSLQADDQAESVLSPPQISVAQINTILAAYHSPAEGKGQALYDLGRAYGISSDDALAFFFHESTLGTAGEATKTLSLGNERCIEDRPCVDQNAGGYAQMNSWEDGFAHWYQLIKDGYVHGQVTIPIVGHPCITIAQIIPVYAPSSDHNDVQGYINSILYAVNAWRSGRVLI
jgi:hypothetical protein